MTTASGSSGNQERPRLTILSLSPIARDARVLREIEAAAEDHDVTVVGWGALDRPRPGVENRPVAPLRLSPPSRALQATLVLLGRVWPGAFERWYWRKPDHRAALRAVIAARPRLIHCNESIALPIALEAARTTSARVLFDAHEYSLDHWTGGGLSGWLSRPLNRWLITRHAPAADAMITVAQGIAARYSADLDVPVGVVMNAPAHRAVAFRPTDPERIIVTHHGAAMRARRLEQLIDTIALCHERFHLEFMLVPAEPGLLDELRAHAERHAPGRVIFRDPVAPHEIVPAVHAADIGLAYVPPRDFSYLHCLPNKLFDFIMAGLAVVSGPSPEMARIVREHECGIITEGFEPQDFAAALDALTADEIDRMKRASLAAGRTLNAEREMETLRRIYRALLEPEDVADHGARERGDPA